MRVTDCSAMGYPDSCEGQLSNSGDSTGHPVATGIYFYQLKPGTDQVSRKMVVVN